MVSKGWQSLQSYDLSGEYEFTGTKPVIIHLKSLWTVLIPILFGLAGAKVKLKDISGLDLVRIIILIMSSLIARCIVTYLIRGIGTESSIEEKLLFSLAWLSKGAVQIAIGAVVLDQAMQLNSTDVSNANISDLKDTGHFIIATVVLFTLLMTPLGFITVLITGPRISPDDTQKEKNYYPVYENFTFDTPLRGTELSTSKQSTKKIESTLVDTYPAAPIRRTSRLDIARVPPTISIRDRTSRIDNPAKRTNAASSVNQSPKASFLQPRTGGDRGQIQRGNLNYLDDIDIPPGSRRVCLDSFLAGTSIEMISQTISDDIISPPAMIRDGRRRYCSQRSSKGLLGKNDLPSQGSPLTLENIAAFNLYQEDRFVSPKFSRPIIAEVNTVSGDIMSHGSRENMSPGDSNMDELSPGNRRISKKFAISKVSMRHEMSGRDPTLNIFRNSPICRPCRTISPSMQRFLQEEGPDCKTDDLLGSEPSHGLPSIYTDGDGNNTSLGTIDDTSLNLPAAPVKRHPARELSFKMLVSLDNTESEKNDLNLAENDMALDQKADGDRIETDAVGL